MGIQQLSDSFENLENLQKLSLAGNELRELTSVKLPMATLEFLDARHLQPSFYISILVSMMDGKNKKAKLRVEATGNWNVSVVDIRRALKASKGLSLYLSKLDADLVEISKRSSRLHFNGELLDTYIKNPKRTISLQW